MTLSGAAGGNPYLAIAYRNPFGLKPRLPPPPIARPVAPVPPPVEVYLSGICTVGGMKKALLQVNDKAARQKIQYLPPLSEGTTEGRIRVVSIRTDTETVLITMDGRERKLTLDEDAPKLAAVAARPVAPAFLSRVPTRGFPSSPLTTRPISGPASGGQQVLVIGGSPGGAAYVPPVPQSRR